MICKCDRQDRYEWSVHSFILTMWYVNMEFVPEYVADIGGFILTMWYVNNAFYELGYRFALVLY